MTEIAKHTLLITSFVTIMMVVVEYFNVLSSGRWQRLLSQQHRSQHLYAALLGAVPGCLGAFAITAMYSHGIVTLGVLVTTMIATTGEASFVILTMVPRQAFLIFVILLLVSIGVGLLIDLFWRHRKTQSGLACNGFIVHNENLCASYPKGHILDQWHDVSFTRVALIIVLFALVIAVAFGQLGPEKWNVARVTFILIFLCALFIVGTVPNHFVDHHLWRHVFRIHTPRIFFWTLGALLVVHLLNNSLQIEGNWNQEKWLILLLVCLLGLIPDSGPHLAFVTLYSQGTIPFSILVASCVVQDGHGMIPVLAHSRKDFLIVKGINFMAGAVLGSVGLSLGI